MRTRSLFLLLPSLVFVAVACGASDDAPPSQDVANGDVDASTSDDDATTPGPKGDNDSGVDAGSDAGKPDTGGDAGFDAGDPDANGDAGSDAGEADTGVDAGPTCAVSNGGCDAHATCDDSTGTVACTCQGGYTGDGKTCALAPTTFAADTNLSTANTNGRTCADGGDMVSYSVVGLDGTTATLATTPAAGCLAIGDEVLVANLQGTATASANTGHYELRVVSAIAGTTVTFASAKTNFFGDGATDDTNLGVDTTNQRVVLQRVPRYGNVVINAGVTITADGWNGTKGGIFAFSAAGSVTSDGTIDMSGKGYIGGPSIDVVNTTGTAGESFIGIGPVATQAASAGGGGGGRGDNTGCKPNGVAAGGGGYGAVGGTAQDAACGGAGGAAYGDDQLASLFFGSGGGSGGTDNVLNDNPHGGQGGAGGGIVFIRAAGAITGNISSRGLAGEGDLPGVDCASGSTTECWDFSGPGGGGAGGSVLIDAPSFTGTADVAGGAAGHGWSNAQQVAGGGANGRVKQP